MKKPGTPRKVKAHKTPALWRLERSDAAWAETMTGLTIAIDACERSGDQDRAASLRALCSALSKAE